MSLSISVNLHSMSKLMLDFLNAGLLKTITIIALNMMPKHPKAMTNTPLTTRSNNSIEGDILYFSIFFSTACKVCKILKYNPWVIWIEITIVIIYFSVQCIAFVHYRLLVVYAKTIPNRLPFWFRSLYA